MSVPHQKNLPVESLSELSRLRSEFHACLTTRADSLFEVCEALVSAPTPAPPGARWPLLHLGRWPSAG